MPPDSTLNPMFLTVKLLLGRRCSLKVSGQESVAMLKKLVSKQLQVPEEQQHLLFRGQLLADDKHLSDYCIGPNASINVIMRPLEKSVPEEAHQSHPLWHHLRRVLAKHFGPQDTKAVLQVLRQEHEERLQRISLGDLEQLARYLLTEEPLVEPAAEREPEATTSEPPDQEAEEKGKADQ
ncbi:ubiquitin-like protein 4B [Equus przewalskii]|uniref:Ubiquitin like 4B n=4 Tax=Equus TaxID=9789 RepID=A0A9L0TJP5_HORSE|nr:ubiquitin-like protein 4B [Equus caballus]XP_008528291.1 PREDICTED: ubiquitin-like protein 4B [Equus przewalskii]XP_014690753.1 ubiquitin-like protein 4B [Equus asinus]